MPQTVCPRADRLARRDAGLRADDGTVLKRAMIRDANLPADDYALADRAAAGNAGLRGENRMLADAHVVRDLHEIVDFHAVADLRGVERPAVDRGVCADLDVVADRRRVPICGNFQWRPSPKT